MVVIIWSVTQRRQNGNVRGCRESGVGLEREVAERGRYGVHFLFVFRFWMRKSLHWVRSVVVVIFLTWMEWFSAAVFVTWGGHHDAAGAAGELAAVAPRALLLLQFSCSNYSTSESGERFIPE